MRVFWGGALAFEQYMIQHKAVEYIRDVSILNWLTKIKFVGIYHFYLKHI